MLGWLGFRLGSGWWTFALNFDIVLASTDGTPKAKHDSPETKRAKWSEGFDRMAMVCLLTETSTRLPEPFRGLRNHVEA